MAGKKQNTAPMRKKFEVYVVEPTSFLDHVYLGCTQRECEPNETIMKQSTKMFDSRISAGATEKHRNGKNRMHKHWRGLAAWRDMLKNALSHTVN